MKIKRNRSNLFPKMCGFWRILFSSEKKKIITWRRYNGFQFSPERNRRGPTPLSVSCSCLVFVRIFKKILSDDCLSVFFLSRFCPPILSGFYKKAVRCLPVRPVFHCPCPPTPAPHSFFTLYIGDRVEIEKLLVGNH